MIRIKVPATSANIGPGFDCLGVALGLYNCFEVEETDAGLAIEGCSEVYRNENNLVIRSMKSCFEKIGYKYSGISLNMNCQLPIARGLGSSAACILGGVAAANELAGHVLREDELLAIATEIEGHPDNLSPALYGGMTVSIKDGGRVYAKKLRISENFCFCALIPDFSLSTEVSRSVLPEKVPYRDAVFNLGRIGLLISAFETGNAEMLRIACEDRLHEIYRCNLIRNYSDIRAKCMELGAWGVFLSGAGPTIMAVISSDNHDFISKITSYLNTLDDKWTALLLPVDNEGIVVEDGKEDIYAQSKACNIGIW